MPRNGLVVSADTVLPLDLVGGGKPKRGGGERPTWTPTREVFEWLLEVLRTGTSMRSVLSYRYALSFLDGFLRSLVPGLAERRATRAAVEARLRALTAAEVQEAYVSYRLRHLRAGSAVSPACVSRHIFLIGVLFRRLGHGLPPAAQWPAIVDHRHRHPRLASLVRRRAGTPHTFSPTEIRALYAAAAADPLERLVLVALFTTGMRIGGLRHARVDGCVVRTAAGGLCARETLLTVEKGGHPMEYRIVPVLAGLLVEWCASAERTAMAPDGADSPLLFPGPDGGELHSGRLQAVFMRVARRAGLRGSHVHAHTTRHTVAWTLAALGNSAETVARELGHRSSRLTSEVYIAFSPAEASGLVIRPWDAGAAGDAAHGAGAVRALAQDTAAAIGGAPPLPTSVSSDGDAGAMEARARALVACILAGGAPC